jgi:ABC-type phosphate transport system substrate-binding protein
MLHFQTSDLNSKPSKRIEVRFLRRWSKLVNFVKTLLGAGIVSAATSAFVANLTAAGVTFPFPLYSKWADAYEKDTGNGVNYQSIGSGGGIKQIPAKTLRSAPPTCH